jgi:DNA-binding transcriptional MerR regulator
VTAYTVQQLARLAGVSVRTLHHYDHLGLLRPSARTAAGYRLYKEHDLLRLQQILFFRELDFPLNEIQHILDRPGFDQVKALENHKRMLKQRAERLERLLKTIDKTILRLTEERMNMTDAELYEGLSKEQSERYPREAREMYGTAAVEESEQRIRKMSKAQWNAVKEEGGAITVQMVELIDRKPSDPEVQKAIARHHAWIEQFFEAPAEVYRALGQGYAEHKEFRAF